VIVARTVAELRAALRSLPRPLGFVPTMGALHTGHLSLLAAARERCASVAASVFVNPAQFGEGEDYDAYPRDEGRDLELLARAGADVVFVPAPHEMYPDGFATTVSVRGPLTESWEGASRPGHFDGVALVVLKLLNAVGPDIVCFGQKDAQQLAVIRRFAHDLALPLEIASVPTVREPDGLAMSSRNAYLTPAERAVAPDLYRALMAGASAAGADGASPKNVIAAAAMLLAAPDAALKDDDDARRELAEPARPTPPRFEIDYVAVVDATTFALETALGPRSLLVAAVRLGRTRLIDNTALPQRAYPATDATSRKESPGWPQ